MRVFPALFATTFALAACGGGGGSSDGGSGDGSSSAFDRTLAASTERTIQAMTEVAGNQPLFGSVSQSSTGSEGMTTTTVTATYDHGASRTPTTLKVMDGSDTIVAFDTNNQRPASSEGPVDLSGSLAGYRSRTDRFYQVDPDAMSASGASVGIMWKSSDATNYIAAGYWIHFSGNIATRTIDRVKIGAFADGPELDNVGNTPMSGSATYQGAAGGLYASKNSSGVSDVGEFSSSVRLTANFNTGTSGTVSGCMGCVTGEEGIEFDGNRDRLARLQFGFADIDSSNGQFRSDSGLTLTYPGFTGTTTGSWGGQFSKMQESSQPRLVTGTFGAKVTQGADEAALVGAFVGAKQ